MEWWLVLIIIFAGLLALLLSGMPVALAFMIFNLAGVMIFWGGQVGISQLVLSLYGSIGTFALLAVPMFILMGEIMFHSELGFHMIDALDKWLGRLPGRLAILSVGAATLFSTTSGSTIATTAMLGSVLVPEMEKRGYNRLLSVGSIVGTGGLAMIIPPSSLAVVLASVAQISVGKLLISGVIPGLLLAMTYAAYIIIRCLLNPSLAPAYEVAKTPLSVKLSLTARDVLPLGIIIFLVIGVIFLGIATPTEAAALGAVGCLGLAAVHRKLNRNVLSKSMTSTLHISVMVLMIMSGSTAFSQILAFSGVSAGLAKFVVALPIASLALFVIMQLVLVFLGTFMSATAIIMISMPIYMPIVHAMGWNEIWFGLITLINMDMAQTTPPFGMLLFTMKSVAPPDFKMGEIMWAAVPFLLCDVFVMGVITVFPPIATWLPSVMLRF